MPETFRDQWERLKRPRDSDELQLKQLEPEIEEALRRFAFPREFQEYIARLGNQQRKYYKDKIADLVGRERLRREHIRWIREWGRRLHTFSKELAVYGQAIDLLDHSSKEYMSLKETQKYWNKQLDEPSGWLKEFKQEFEPILIITPPVEVDYPTAIRELARSIHQTSHLHKVPLKHVCQDISKAMQQEGEFEGLLFPPDDNMGGKTRIRRIQLAKFINSEFDWLPKTAGPVYERLKEKCGQSPEYSQLAAAYGLGTAKSDNSIRVMIHRDLKALLEECCDLMAEEEDDSDMRRRSLARLIAEQLPFLVLGSRLDLIVPAQVRRILELPEYQLLKEHYCAGERFLKNKFYDDLKAIKRDPKRYGLQ